MRFRRLVSVVGLTAMVMFGCSLPAVSTAAPAANQDARVVFDPPKPQKFSEDVLPELELSGSLLFQILASEIALQRGELGAAFTTYMKVAEETGDPRLAERAFEIAQLAQAPKELLKAVLLWNKLAPGNKKAQEMLIRLGIHFEQYNRVLPTVISYLSQVPKPGEEISRIQSQLLVGKDRKKALSFFKRATAKYKNLVETKLGLARLESLAGNRKTAESLAKAAYKQSPNSETVMALATVLLRSKSATAQKEARQVLAQYLSRNLKDTKVRDSYAQLLLLANDYDQFLSLVKKYPQDHAFELSAAVSLLQNGKEEDGKAILLKLSKLQQDKNDQSVPQKALLLLSELELEQKNYKQALDYTGMVTGLMRPAALIQKANIYSKQGNYEQALTTLKAVDSTDNPAIAEEVAIVEARLITEIKDDKAALAHLESFLKKQPEAKNAHYEAGMLAERLDDIKKTESHLREAIKIDPGFANAFNSLGYTLLERTNRLKEAEEFIKAAYRLEPQNPYILDSMGWLYYKQKKYAEAINYLNDALLQLESEDIMLHLAEVYWISNQHDEARLTLKRAKELWPDSEDIDALVKTLGIK